MDDFDYEKFEAVCTRVQTLLHDCYPHSMSARAALLARLLAGTIYAAGALRTSPLSGEALLARTLELVRDLYGDLSRAQAPPQVEVETHEYAEMQH